MMTGSNSLMSPHATKTVVKLVPPDGGWGWMVVLGTALSNVSTHHLFLNFIPNLFNQ